MMRHLVRALGLAAIVSTGCQDEFEEECSAFCPGEPTICPQGNVDCTRTCADQTRSADPQGCRAESVAYWRCLTETDLCSETVPEECKNEFDAFYVCLGGELEGGGAGG